MEVPEAGQEPLRRWDPERIGPYVILGRLGAGAMGQVYLGRSSAGRLVAVKTIKVGLAEESGFRIRFAQEVAAARRVSGAFTAAVVGADPDADVPWLATSYVPAPSLYRLVLACGPLPVAAVRWLAAGCAEALESIHGVGLVHRDLKPSNVLVAPDGPRVIDFGVARAAERMAASTSRGAVGTPAYMAPEQARDNRQAAAPSDMYSLGATLLFAATGHPPYGGDAVLDVLSRLAAEEPDLSCLPAELTELVTGCMRRDPRARLTPPDLLAQLGQFDETLAEEHSYLPDSAMALISEYQRSPLLASAGQQRGEEPEDATSASYTELPASYKPPARRRPPRRPPPGDQQPHDQDTDPEPERRAPRRWARTHLAWIGWVSVGAALVAGGVILGASLTSSSSPPGPPPVAPSTVCGSQVPIGAAPVICMNVSEGTEKTAFLVKGRGFVARSPVTLTMSEIGPPPAVPQVIPPTPPVTLQAGSDGTFQVLISRLYPDTLPLGKVTVDVTGAGDRTATTQFIVIPSQVGQGGQGNQGGQGGPPPAG